MSLWVVACFDEKWREKLLHKLRNAKVQTANCKYTQVRGNFFCQLMWSAESCGSDLWLGLVTWKMNSGYHTDHPPAKYNEQSKRLAAGGCCFTVFGPLSLSLSLSRSPAVVWTCTVANKDMSSVHFALIMWCRMLSQSLITRVEWKSRKKGRKSKKNQSKVRLLLLLPVMLVLVMLMLMLLLVRCSPCPLSQRLFCPVIWKKANAKGGPWPGLDFGSWLAMVWLIWLLQQLSEGGWHWQLKKWMYLLLKSRKCETTPRTKDLDLDLACTCVNRTHCKLTSSQ